MKIAASALHFEATHLREEHSSLISTLRAWRDAPADQNAQASASPAAPPSTQISLSDAARCAQAQDGCSAEAIDEAVEAAENDPRLRLIRALIALLTGKDPLHLKLSDLTAAPATTADPPQAPPSAPADPAAEPPSNNAALGWGVEFSERFQYSESEQLSFSASGIIRTADGQEIRFELSLNLSRSFSFSSETNLKLGDAARPKKDPLILNFAGPAAQLTSQRFAFDLDADGKPDQIHFATGGSGFLAIDRNANGQIDDGRELFGAKTGNGFAELSEFDSDGNGWIDENDPGYVRLSLLRKDTDGTAQVVSLAEVGVGAIALAHAKTPFEITDEQQGEIGQLRSSGVYLKENGTAGTVQQIDLTA